MASASAGPAWNKSTVQMSKTCPMISFQADVIASTALSLGKDIFLSAFDELISDWRILKYISEALYLLE